MRDAGQRALDWGAPWVWLVLGLLLGQGPAAALGRLGVEAQLGGEPRIGALTRWAPADRPRSAREWRQAPALGEARSALVARASGSLILAQGHSGARAPLQRLAGIGPRIEAQVQRWLAQRAPQGARITPDAGARFRAELALLPRSP